MQKICAGFETTLTAKLTASGSSFNLSTHVNKAGNELSGEYGFILDEGTATEEWCYGTVANGAVTIIKRGLDPENPETEVGALKFEHDRGHSVKITDYPFLGFLKKYIAGEKPLPSALKYELSVPPANPTELITKEYAEQLLAGGVGTASPSAAGTVFIERDMGSLPIARAIIANQQLAHNMTIKVGAFSIAEIDKVVTFAGGNSPVMVAPVTNPRIDIVVYDIAAAALEVRAGSENASPVAPALENGDIALVKIYHRVGETSIKNSSDGTNGYISALYDPAVTRNDILLNTDTTIQKFETMPAYENLVLGNFIKAVNDGGVAKLKKIAGISSDIQGTTSEALEDSGTEPVIRKLSANKYVAVYGKNGASYVFAMILTVSGSAISFGSSVQLDLATGLVSNYRRRYTVVVEDESKFVVIYGYNTTGQSYVKGMACTVSGTTITPSGSTTIWSTTTNSTPSDIQVGRLAANKYIVVWSWNSQPYYNTFSVSGTTLTIGSVGTFAGSNYLIPKLTIIGTDKFMVTIIYSSGYNHDYWIGTVSNLTVTLGAKKTLISGTSSEYTPFVIPFMISDTAGIYLSYLSTAGTTLRLGYFTVSGDTATLVGAPTTFVSTLDSNAYDIAKIQLIIFEGVLYMVDYVTLKLMKFIFDSSGNFVLKATHSIPSMNGRLPDALINIGDRLLLLHSWIGSSSSNGVKMKYILLDHDEFLAVSNGTYNIGDSVPLASVFNGFSNLVIGVDYHLNSTASGLTIANTYQKVGKAISATKIMK